MNLSRKKKNFQKRPAVFLDRDGVLITRANPTWKKNQIKLREGAKLLRFFNERNIPVVVVTNQSVVARGLISEAGVEKLHRFIRGKLRKLGVYVDAFYFCPHHPDADVKKYRIACACRKPKIRLFKKAATDLNIDLKNSVSIGDMTSDILAGKRIGGKTILLRAGHGGRDKKYRVKPDYTARDLEAALRLAKKII